MRRPPPNGMASVLASMALIIVLCGSAFAYFSASGTGSATASVAKFSAPTISSALPAIGGTVALTWTAVTAPGPGTVTYAVIRDGGEPAGNCPTVSSRGTGTTCTDSGLEVGTHTYTVTAKWRTWSSTSASTAGESDRRRGDPLHDSAQRPARPRSGVADNLTISALDEKGSTVTTYTGSHSLTFSGASASPGGTSPTVANSSGTAIAFGSATAINFTLGVATVTSSKNGVLKLYRAGATSVSVSDGSIESESDLAVTVAPAAASKLVLSAASTTPTAGSADDLTTTAQDAYGNTATAYTGSHSLTFSGASASPNGETPTVTDSSGAAVAFGSATAIVFSAGVASASGSSNGTMKLYKSGSTSLKVSDGTFTSAASVVTVVAGTRLEALAERRLDDADRGCERQPHHHRPRPLRQHRDHLHRLPQHHLLGRPASPSGTAPTVVNATGTAVSFGTATALTFSRRRRCSSPPRKTA